MKNLKKALSLLQEHLVDVVKIAVWNILLGFLANLLSYITIIGVIGSVIVSSVAICFNLYMYNELVLESRELPFIDMWNDFYTYFKGQFQEYLVLLAVYNVITALFIITLLILFFFMVFSLMAFNYFMIFLFLMFACTIVYAIIILYIEYKIAEKITDCHPGKNYVGQILLMLGSGFLLLLIPLVGWILLIPYALVVPIKILLDVKEEKEQVK